MSNSPSTRLCPLLVGSFVALLEGSVIAADFYSDPAVPADGNDGGEAHPWQTRVAVIDAGHIGVTGVSGLVAVRLRRSRRD